MAIPLILVNCRITCQELELRLESLLCALECGLVRVNTLFGQELEQRIERRDVPKSRLAPFRIGGV